MHNLARMTLLRLALIASTLLAFTGCQSGEYVQFVLPHSHEAQLRSVLRSIGLRHRMAEKTGASNAPGTIVFLSEGDLSHTHLGARRHGDVIVVDLLFRSAGVGGKLFRELEPEVTQALQKLYPGAVRIERDYRKLIAVHPNT